MWLFVNLFFCGLMLSIYFCGIGLLYDILWLAFSGEMDEQATKQIVAICCRCKLFFTCFPHQIKQKLLYMKLCPFKFGTIAAIGVLHLSWLEILLEGINFSWKSYVLPKWIMIHDEFSHASYDKSWILLSLVVAYPWIKWDLIEKILGNVFYENIHKIWRCSHKSKF